MAGLSPSDAQTPTEKPHIKRVCTARSFRVLALVPELFLLSFASLVFCPCRLTLLCPCPPSSKNCQTCCVRPSPRSVKISQDAKITCLLLRRCHNPVARAANRDRNEQAISISDAVPTIVCCALPRCPRDAVRGGHHLVCAAIRNRNEQTVSKGNRLPSITRHALLCSPRDGQQSI